MNTIDLFEIKNTSVADSYSRLISNNTELCSGSKKSRLQFPLQSSTSKNTADVYVEVIGNDIFDSIKSFFLSKMNRKFVKCTHQGNLIYINVNSLSTRIGISKEQIYANAENEKLLCSMINQHYQRCIETERVADVFFNTIVKEHYIDKGDKILTSDGQRILSKNYLRKLVGIAAFSRLNSKEEQDVAYSLKDGRILLLKKQKDSEWPLLILFSGHVLGSGSFGWVQIVTELSIGRVSAAKIANVENENTILNALNDDNSHIGIQQKPYLLFDFSLEGEKYSGYITLKYDCSLDNMISELNDKGKIQCARQLLAGLVELEKRQICHGDIRPSNCLCKRNVDGSIKSVIADFGCSKDMLKDSFGWPIGCEDYRCENDDNAYAFLHRQYELGKTQREKDERLSDAKNLAFRRDVYAMGSVMYELFSSYSNQEKLREMRCLIDRMKNSSWRDRVSAREVLLEFEKIFISS